MEERIRNLKNESKKVLREIVINTAIGDNEMIKFLKDIENRNIKEDEIEILERTIENIKMFFYTKKLMKCAEEDYNFLKITAERLRTQKIRIKDEVIMGQPIFEVEMSDNKSEEFITKEGAQNFIDANTTITKCSDIVILNEDNDLERRKKEIFNVNTNKNLELERLIEVIIRNY